LLTRQADSPSLTCHQRCRRRSRKPGSGSRWSSRSCAAKWDATCGATDTSRLSHQLRRLEKRGLVLRSAGDGSDGRATVVALSDDEVSAYRRAIGPHLRSARRWFAEDAQEALATDGTTSGRRRRGCPGRRQCDLREHLRPRRPVCGRERARSRVGSRTAGPQRCSDLQPDPVGGRGRAPRPDRGGR